MKKLLSGNQAIVEGAKKAGGSYFAGYPITPASEIMHDWAAWADSQHKSKDPRDIKFLQTEDEIAAVHSIIGAALAGRKAFTATSGPGFSLMQEGIGWAYAIQAPIVIINSQRQGPSTGMPTMPAQGDILQTQFGSHSDYQTIVFYPNSVQECYEYTIRAFNAAQEAQSPVVLLTDAFLSHLIEAVELDFNEKIIDIKSSPLTKLDKTRYFTGLTSVNNIPKTKDPEAFIKWENERSEKIQQAASKYPFHELYGRQDAK
ncbi:2-oxoacid:acceptor oxidoreductase subunit alpha, partial [Candidatus Dojkabacteria bacterium]|nr:2-oxoacid:acceptor oxidoreductase subunit alpha [Candidatus Dojkabacteria bacterium]